MYTIHSDFDIDLHAEHFIDYLEIVISPEGKCYYAIPSHVQFLEKVLKQQCCQNAQDYQQLIDKHLYNWPSCLCNLTGYCMLWNDFICKPLKGLTKAQEETIYKLMTKHYTKITSMSLYRGTL